MQTLIKCFQYLNNELFNQPITAVGNNNTTLKGIKVITQSLMLYQIAENPKKKKKINKIDYNSALRQ